MGIILAIIVLVVGYAIIEISENWPFYLALFVLFIILAIIIAVREHKQKEEQFNSIDLSNVDMMRGTEFEQYVAKLLEKNGYTNVSVTKASGDYGVDVLAKYAGKQYAFQCKRYSGKIGVKSVQEIYSGAKMYRAEYPVVITNSYFTQNAAKFARELNVQLWDRSKLSQLIELRPSNVQISPPLTKFYNQPQRNSIQSTCSKPPQKEEQPSINKTTPVKISTNHSPAQTPQKSCTSITPKTNLNKNKIEVTIDMATVLGAGTYAFGKNIPAGTYDLTAVRGKGYLTPFNLEGDELSLINFGVEDFCAKEYHGLSSEDFKKFVVEGCVEFEIKRAQMITID